MSEEVRPCGEPGVLAGCSQPSQAILRAFSGVGACAEWVPTACPPCRRGEKACASEQHMKLDMVEHTCYCMSWEAEGGLMCLRVAWARDKETKTPRPLLIPVIPAIRGGRDKDQEFRNSLDHTPKKGRGRETVLSSSLGYTSQVVQLDHCPVLECLRHPRGTCPANTPNISQKCSHTAGGASLLLTLFV